MSTSNKDNPTHPSIDSDRRAALIKLAKLSAYTAPTVMTLLASERAHAQTSEALMDLNNGQIMNICMNWGDFNGNLGNDQGWNNTGGDC